jgi:transcriptional regulator with XRE-family HTH domain
MWLDIIRERRKELGYTYKYIAQESKFPERTVSRIFSGETPSPQAITLHRIADVLGISMGELFAESNVVIGSKNYTMLHEEVDKLTAEVERLSSELVLLTAENVMLKDKVGVLTSENDILRLKLDHKEEIISLHNYYMKKND